MFPCSICPVILILKSIFFFPSFSASFFFVIHVFTSFFLFYFVSNSKEVVFLYQLEEGVCPSSYGMNVASVAGIPQSVISISSFYAPLVLGLTELRKDNCESRRNCSKISTISVLCHCNN